MTTLTDDEMLAWLNQKGRHKTDDAVLRQLAARFRELIALQEWQPIETAPRDGTYILVCNHDAGVSWIAKYMPDDCWKPMGGFMSMMLNLQHAKKRYPSSKPTHWRPLPPPPKDGEK